eukprot:4315996-Amphidinium_carterae.1
MLTKSEDPRASEQLRGAATPTGPGRGAGASSGPEGKVAESGNEPGAAEPVPEDTQECIMWRVPVSACTLSWAALLRACCARTRPRA